MSCQSKGESLYVKYSLFKHIDRKDAMMDEEERDVGGLCRQRGQLHPVGRIPGVEWQPSGFSPLTELHLVTGELAFILPNL